MWHHNYTCIYIALEINCFLVKKGYQYKHVQVHLMTTKAPEERSRDSAVYEISRRLKFEPWQTFIFLKTATDFLFPSLQYQLPSSPNTLALKAIIISVSSRQPVPEQLCPRRWMGEWERGLPQAPLASAGWAGRGWKPTWSLACWGEGGRTLPKAFPSLCLQCSTLSVGVCPPRGAHHPAGAEPTLLCRLQTPCGTAPRGAGPGLGINHRTEGRKSTTAF